MRGKADALYNLYIFEWSSVKRHLGRYIQLAAKARLNLSVDIKKKQSPVKGSATVCFV